MPFDFSRTADVAIGEIAFADPSPEEYADRLREMGRIVIHHHAGRFTAQCPVHNDRTPSLSISPGRDKPLVLHCHGCGASYHELLAAAGFKPSTPSITTSLSHGSSPSPCPSVHIDKDWHRPELEELLDAHEAGLLDPLDVQLGELPVRAGHDARRVAEDLALLLGLRYADGEHRSVPCSTRFCARRMGWSDHARASKALRRLERWGVVSVTVLPRREGVFVPYGTKAYGPPSDKAVLPAHTSAQVDGVGEIMLEPDPEVIQQPVVDDAVVRPGGEVGVVAAGDTALADSVVSTTAVQVDKFTLAHSGSPFVVARGDDGSATYRQMCRCVYNQQGHDDDGRCRGCGGWRELADAFAA